MDRYLREECNLSINKQEFINYFDIKYQHNESIFVIFHNKYNKYQGEVLKQC